MAYTSVRAGAEAIAAAEQLIQERPLEEGEALLELRQVRNQLRAAVEQIMGEGGLYAPDLAALALQQAEGDMAEAAFMLRAYRSTLPRLGYAEPVRGDEMEVSRRISSAFRDIPGGQLLGRTRDYTQRLLDLDDEPSPPDRDPLRGYPARRAGRGGTLGDGVAQEEKDSSGFRSNGHGMPPDGAPSWTGQAKKVSDTMRAMGLIPPLAEQAVQPDPDDITRHSMRFPVGRTAWLQALARAETGALVCLAYSALRGYGGGDHGTIADLRVGELPLRVTHPFTNQPLTVGTYRVTECEMTGREKPKADVASNGHAKPAMYGLSYGLVFGQNERKAIAMSVLDSALIAGARGDGHAAPANDHEMVLSNTDGIESFGFVEHLKLPHFVTFSSGLQVTEQLNLTEDQATAATTSNGSQTVATANGADVATTVEES